MKENKKFTEGLSSFNQGKFKKAREKFSTVIKEDPSNARAWQYAAMTLYKLRMYEEARTQITKAYELDPQSIEICFEFIKILLKTGPYEELLQFCQENQKLDPKRFKYKLIEVHERLKRYTPALEHLNDLLTLQSEDSYLLRLKDYLSQGERNCHNYYISVIQSGLLPHIPIGEEIIYSSNMKIHWEIIIPLQDRKWSSVANFISEISHSVDFILDMVDEAVGDKTIRGERFTDVLMTHEGIIFRKQNSKKKNEVIAPQFIPWRNIKVEKNSTLVIDDYLKFDFISSPSYESNSSFIVRKQKFYDYIIAKRYQYTKKCLEKLIKYVKDFRDADAQEWLNRGNNSNIWHSDYNLGKQLAEAFDPAKVRLRRLEKEVSEKAENIILTYLNENKGKAFTSISLGKRIGEIIKDSKILSYVNKNLDGILNRLVYSGRIKSDTHYSTQLFYFIP